MAFYQKQYISLQFISSLVEGNALDFFRIINYVRGESHDCAEYPKKSGGNIIENIRGMRVNCEHSPEVDTVQLKTKKRKSFYVAEIEIHTFGNFYYGASELYKRDTLKIMIKLTIKTLLSCCQCFISILNKYYFYLSFWNI